MMGTDATKPTDVQMARPIPAAIPAELRTIARWVCWRARPNARGRTDKVPHDARTGRVCDVQDPASRQPFAAALGAMRRWRLDGIGLVMVEDDDLVGVDLDDCTDQVGTVAPWAQAIVAALETYTERSPLGRGLRCFAFGGLPPGRRKADGLELYDRARFLTVTGHHLAGTPRTVEHRDWELRDLHARCLGGDAPEMPANAVIPGAVVVAPPVRLDARGLAIWRGERPARKADGTTDRSRTLYALACVLARAGATVPTLVAALAERDRALGLHKYSARPDGGAGEYRRMAERAAQTGVTTAEGDGLAGLAAEQRRQRRELERLRAEHRATVRALRAGGRLVPRQDEL